MVVIHTNVVLFSLRRFGQRDLGELQVRNAVETSSKAVLKLARRIVCTIWTDGRADVDSGADDVTSVGRGDNSTSWCVKLNNAWCETALRENGSDVSARPEAEDRGVILRCFYPIVFKSREAIARTFVIKKEEELVLDDGSTDGSGELAQGIIDRKSTRLNS